MLSFFQKKDYWGNGLSIWVLAALLFGTPFLISLLKSVEMNNEVEAWLPARDPQAVLLTWYNENFPVKDRLFLTWQGSSLSDPRVELLAAKLEGYVDPKGVDRRGSAYVSEVLTPQESLLQMRSQKIDQSNSIESLTGLLVGKGTLKVRLTEAGKERQGQIEEQIRQAAQDQLQLEVTVLPRFQEWQPPPEFSEFAQIRQKSTIVLEHDDDALAPEEPLEFEPVPEHDFQLSWHLMKAESALTEQVQALIEQISQSAGAEPLVEESFFVSGSPISMVVTLNDAGEADRTTALDDINRIAQECFIPAEAIHVGGRPVGSAMLNEEVKKASFDPEAPWYLRSVIGMSTLVSFALAFLMVRSFRLGLLVLTVSLYATLITVSLVPLSGTTMNMVLIVMPTLLSVLTLSGAIHLVSYWKHAAQNNNPNGIVLAIRMAAQPCFLASATTAIGLASLMSSTLNPVRDFGIFAAIGCGISLVFILFVLPSLMQIWPGKPPEEHEVDGRTWKLLAHWILGHSTAVVVVCLAMFAAGIYGLQYFKTETKVVRYFPDDSRIITDYWFLEDHVVGVNTVDTIIRFDQQSQKDLMFLERLEIVRQVTEKVRQHGEITGALSLADFQRSFPKPGPKARFLERAGYNKRSNELETRMKEGDISAAGTMFTTSTRDSDWKEQGDRLLGSRGDELWRISAQAYVMADNDYGALMDELDSISESVLAAHPGTSHSVTGMVPVFLRTQEALLESLIWSFGMAFGIIALVLMFLLKNPLAGLITMLPNLMPVAFCFGMLSMMGIRVDIGTMITASVALGIAVDGTLHLLTWFREGIQSGKSRQESIELGLAHCAPAMWQTSAIVAIGLLMLAPAPLLMISRFGVLMASLIVAALIADILFLPALLNGLLGRVIEGSELKRMSNRRRLPAPANHDHGDQPAEQQSHGQSVTHEKTPEATESYAHASIAGPHRTSSKNAMNTEFRARHAD